MPTDIDNLAVTDGQLDVVLETGIGIQQAGSVDQHVGGEGVGGVFDIAPEYARAGERRGLGLGLKLVPYGRIPGISSG